MSGDSVLGSFEEQVMLAVVHAHEEAYGMAIRREIEERTGREVAIGAVYATLDRLEAKGLLSSARPRGDGPSRRLFQLTMGGVRALAETRLLHEQLWRGVDLTRLARGKA
ncbi:MAG: helix-turn-helix transcriptional regulator [Gemmatimonadaceae bacterium]